MSVEEQRFLEKFSCMISGTMILFIVIFSFCAGFWLGTFALLSVVVLFSLLENNSLGIFIENSFLKIIQFIDLFFKNLFTLDERDFTKEEKFIEIENIFKKDLELEKEETIKGVNSSIVEIENTKIKKENEDISFTEDKLLSLCKTKTSKVIHIKLVSEKILCGRNLKVEDKDIILLSDFEEIDKSNICKQCLKKIESL